MQTGVTLTNAAILDQRSKAGAFPAAPVLLRTVVFLLLALAPVARGQDAASFTSLYSFSGLDPDMNGNLDGAGPTAALIQGSDGCFYGTTTSGGQVDSASAEGTVFKVTPGGVLTTQHSFFDSNDGAVPCAALVQGSDGNFYGTTSSGGGLTQYDPGAGTVFRLTPAGVLTTLHVFTTLDTNQANADGGESDGGVDPGQRRQLLRYDLCRGFRRVRHGLPDHARRGADHPDEFSPERRRISCRLAGPGPRRQFLRHHAERRDAQERHGLPDHAHRDVDQPAQLQRQRRGVPLMPPSLKAGQTRKAINIIPQGDLGGASKKTVKLVLEPGTGYTVGAADSAEVKIIR